MSCLKLWRQSGVRVRSARAGPPLGAAATAPRTYRGRIGCLSVCGREGSLGEQHQSKIGPPARQPQRVTLRPAQTEAGFSGAGQEENTGRV